MQVTSRRPRTRVCQAKSQFSPYARESLRALTCSSELAQNNDLCINLSAIWTKTLVSPYITVDKRLRGMWITASAASSRFRALLVVIFTGPDQPPGRPSGRSTKNP